ncbi:MAG: NAD(P)/FAD-dependent oxidoreductase [Candidatus Sumerlaeia bacterium]
MPTKRIGIIGGGIAALATAYRLTQSSNDVAVTILEQDSQLGGLARSFKVAGLPVDMGPHRIFTEIPEIKEFLKDFLSDQWFLVKRRSQMFYKGGYFDYPIKVGGALKHLGLLTTMRFGVGAVLASLTGGRGAGADQTFDGVMKGAFGGPVYHELIMPYIKKVWKMDPADIDAEVARLRVSAGGLEKILRQALGREKSDDPSAVKEFYYLPNGFQDMVDKYTAVLDGRPVRWHTQARVVEVEQRSDGRVRVRWDGRGAQGNEEFDFCFSTIPVDDLIRMLTAHRPDDAALRAADSLRYLSMILIYLIARKPRISANSWLYFPEPHIIFNRGYESKNFNPHIQSDNAVLCLEVTCYRGDSTWRRSDDDVAAQVVREFCATGMLDPGDVAGTVVTRLTHAYPILHRGYKKDLGVLWNYLREMPGLITLGRQGLFQHNNTDHSQFMGFCAADLYRRSTSPSREWYDAEIKKFDHFRIVD